MLQISYTGSAKSIPSSIWKSTGLSFAYANFNWPQIDPDVLNMVTGVLNPHKFAPGNIDSVNFSFLSAVG